MNARSAAPTIARRGTLAADASEALHARGGLPAALCLAVIACWVFSYFAPFGQGWDTSWNGNEDGYRIRVWVADRGSLHLRRNAPTRMGIAYRDDRARWVEPRGRSAAR